MGKDDKTWLNLSYVLLLGIVCYVLRLAFDALFLQIGWLDRYTWSENLSLGLAVVTGSISIFMLQRDIERQDYFLASIAELRKVVWPNYEETKKMTYIVAIVVAIFSIALTLFDIMVDSLWTVFFNVF